MIASNQHIHQFFSAPLLLSMEQFYQGFLYTRISQESTTLMTLINQRFSQIAWNPVARFSIVISASLSWNCNHVEWTGLLPFLCIHTYMQYCKRSSISQADHWTQKIEKYSSNTHSTPYKVDTEFCRVIVVEYVCLVKQSYRSGPAVVVRH
jgi:hypothetical protein